MSFRFGGGWRCELSEHFLVIVLCVWLVVSKCIWVQRTVPDCNSGASVQLSVWHILVQLWAAESERGVWWWLTATSLCFTLLVTVIAYIQITPFTEFRVNSTVVKFTYAGELKIRMLRYQEHMLTSCCLISLLLSFPKLLIVAYNVIRTINMFCEANGWPA